MVDQLILATRYFNGDPSVKRRLAPPTIKTIYKYVALRDTEMSGEGGVGGWRKSYKKLDSIAEETTLESQKASAGVYFDVILEDWELVSIETNVTQGFQYFECP